MENIGYALIGTPDGLQMRTKGILENRKIGGFVDLPNRDINLIDSKDEILAVVREYDGDNLTTYFVLYRYALEIERNRTGAFYGSVVALKNCKAPGAIIYVMLIELASQVAAWVDPQTKKFRAPLDKIRLNEPHNLTFLVSSVMRYERFVAFEEGRECFVPSPKTEFTRIAFIEAALNEEPLVQYQKCFLSESPHVDKYVREQGGLVYFAHQRNTEDGLISFGTNKNIDFHFSLKLTNTFLQEIGELEGEIKRLKKTNEQLEARVTESLKGKKMPEKKETERSAPQQSEEVRQPPEQRTPYAPPISNPAPVNVRGTNSRKKEKSSLINQFFRKLRRIWRPLAVFVAFLLIGLLAFILFGKYTSYFTDSQSNHEQEVRKPSQEYFSSSGAKPAYRPAEKDNKLSDKQHSLWKEIEAYLVETKLNLSYEKPRMDNYKTRMEEAGMSNLIQYRIFMKLYNNFRGSGLPFEELKEISIKPSNETDLGIIVTDTLTVTQLASFLIKKCSNLPDVYSLENIKQVMINSNPDDIDRESKIIPRHDSEIRVYIPKGATCNLN